jgi:uncharacterized protein YegJ (DUF2314 family)
VDVSGKNPDGVDYRLANAEALNSEHPDTFLIPSQPDRAALQPGDLVKLMFEVVDALDDVSGAERMWVTVVAATGSEYVGSLDNEPATITTIDLGGRIEFGPQHVIEIWDNSQ